MNPEPYPVDGHMAAFGDYVDRLVTVEMRNAAMPWGKIIPEHPCSDCGGIGPGTQGGSGSGGPGGQTVGPPGGQQVPLGPNQGGHPAPPVPPAVPVIPPVQQAPTVN